MGTLSSLLLGLLFLIGFLFGYGRRLMAPPKSPDEGNTKIIWTIIIVFTNLMGAVVYWLVRRSQRYAELRRWRHAA